MRPQLPTSMVPTTTYGELHPGSSQVTICMRNLSAHSIEVPTKTTVGKVTLANQVPPVVLLMETPERMDPQHIEPPGPRGVA